MKSIKRRAAHFLTLAAALMFGSSALVLTACNTTEGVGRDVEAAGEGIQDAAN